LNINLGSSTGRRRILPRGQQQVRWKKDPRVLVIRCCSLLIKRRHPCLAGRNSDTM